MTDQIYRPRRRPKTLVRLTQAADELGVPRATVRSWASEPGRKLHPVGLDDDYVAVYDLDKIRDLVASTKRRKRKAKS